MTSKLSSGRIAADTNVVLSAATAGAAYRVFRSARGLQIVTTEFNYEEMEKRLPRLADYYALDLSDVADNLKALPLEIYPERKYRSHLAEAQRYLENRDPSDAPLAALALKLQIPVWSNDKDFEEIPLLVYPTAKLLKMLGL